MIRHLCDPTGTRADYGPTAQNKIKLLGFQKGRAPFVAFRPFWPLKMDPSGASPAGALGSAKEIGEADPFHLCVKAEDTPKSGPPAKPGA